MGVLVPIFDSFHLNTTKYLNYLAFREVVMMRTTKAVAVQLLEPTAMAVQLLEPTASLYPH